MIELRNVNKSFNDRAILKNISFEIHDGETFVIIGQSGTGKTVTLRHIAGLIEPDSGDVRINNVCMNGAVPSVRKKIRESMGILFQSGALLNWMTVGENVALPLVEHRSYPPEIIQQIVDEKLRILQLLEAKDKLPANISGGMQKRAGLARALVRNPEIILYDEPTSGLDPVMSSMINELIKKMQTDFKVTSVVVTHDMNSAYDIADRIAMLYKGEIIACDVPEKIRSSTNPIVRQFVEGRLEGPINVYRG